ncbi:MAG: hypothetical protein DRG78_16595 [Epsilonproteobacteria bacterium]|nr:MAG: hypothetical protein DRG78_16595 [Campylobacterota bacterium]
MKKQTTKQFYTNLLKYKYNDTSSFLIEIRNENHIFWEICRDFTKEILLSQYSWNWLGYRVDDFALIVEKHIIEKLDKWSKKSSLSKHSKSLEGTIIWLFDRHVNSLKNLFDKRYKNSIDFTILLDFEEVEIEIQDDMINEVILSDFHRYRKFDKVVILLKLWNDSLYDYDFNISDLEEICVKYSAPPPSSFLEFKNSKKYKSQLAKSGNSQLVFTF